MLEVRKYTVLDILRLPLRCAPLPGALVAAFFLLSGIVPTIQVLAASSFIDTAVRVVRDGGSVGAVYAPLLAVVGLLAWTWLSDGLRSLAAVRLELGLRAVLRTAIVEKRARLAYRHVEDPETWDLAARVAKEPEARLRAAYTDLLGIVSTAAQVAGVLVLLVVHAWWAALLIAALSVPLFMLAMRSGRANYDVDREVTRSWRRADYLSDVLSCREAVEERTLFGFGGKVNDRYRAQFEEARRTETRTRLVWFVKMKSGSLLFGLVSLMVALVLIQPVMAGSVTVGLFISLVSAVFALVQTMSWGLTYSVDQLARNAEYMRDLTRFAALEEAPGAVDAPSAVSLGFESLELRAVRFRYPGTEAYVLDGLSLSIHAGGHYALVGLNGAGKSTVIKLITGFYGGFEGEILVNGRPIERYAQAELKALFAVAWQDFARYAVPMRDAIALGDVNAMGRPESTSRLEAAVDAAGLRETAGRLPRGLDSVLGKVREGGVDISGGEWQRVAMARAVMSPAPVRVLDEPTAALDPVSESRLYEQYGRLSGGKTTIFISHRLGSTKLANEIFVIGGGRVAERGTHAALMAAGGLYAEMFESQRSWYR
jgi:ATP-binding cassette, subfamily B, bacterial